MLFIDKFVKKHGKVRRQGGGSGGRGEAVAQGRQREGGGP